MADKSCLNCKHFNFKIWGTCKAFPEGIPLEINDGTFDHVKVHPDQDNKLVFEEKND
ncbi:MAG: cytoplasmic protein [Deltaproteobacteria bacterium]|nr:cytoplasmic protein [Deltaproteobacteria bacterium]